MRTDVKKRVFSETGQAMVEFILVLPILLLVIMGCMEISWYLTSKYSLSQYASSVGHNIQPPFSIYWKRQTRPGDWVDAADGRKPSWLSSREKALWSFDEYDGWYAFTEPASGEVIGSKYFLAAFDSKEQFDERLEDGFTILDRSEISYTMRGGWYINAESLQLPAGGGGGWKLKRFSEKIELYTADVKVDMVYHYKPLTPLGEWLFCRNGTDYMELKTEGRYVYNLEPAIFA